VTKLVIDANAGIASLLPEANSAKALQLRADFRSGIHELLAPDLYFIEVSNVLTHKAKVGVISKADLPFYYQELIRHQLIIIPLTSVLHRAYQIASTLPVSAYDAIYLALSEQEQCPLIFDDAKLMKAAQGFSVIPLSQV
jgi:predicted nucleic acid-binding protein